MKLKDLFKTTRASEWWEYKIPPLFAIAYATIIKGDAPLFEIVPWLVFLLIALVWGGAYAHTLNDITDIEEDLACGKANRMAKIAENRRWLIPFTCFLGGFVIFCFFIILGDYLSAVIYALPCISFTLYSLKPIRLKERGIWGLLADALGAHVFISLLMVSSMSFFSDKPIDMMWFCFVGVWSLLYGLRGILWHQYFDRNNDLKTSSSTFATKTSPEKIRKFEKILLGFELLAFCGMLVNISLPILGIFMILYLLLVIFRYKIMSQKLVIILNPKNSSLQILMIDFYHLFFPLGILVYLSYTQELGWILLLIHLILFPRKFLGVIRDVFISFKTVERKFRRSFDVG